MRRASFKPLVAAVVLAAVGVSACSSVTASTATIGVFTAFGAHPARAPMTPQWSMVGLGDSIPAGYACPGCTPFPELYGRQLTAATGSAVAVMNLGVGGWTSADLLRSLDAGQPDAQVVAASEVVTVTIGANDFYPALDTYLAGACGGADDLDCFTPVLPQLSSTLSAILGRVSELRVGQPTAVLVTGYWDVFPDGDVAAAVYGPQFSAASATLTRAANTIIQTVTERAGSTYVDLFTPFKGVDRQLDPTALLADDGDHPSQAGHQLIADLLARADLAPLTLPRA